jgi:adenine-specific DNA-methyltransferase
MLSRAEKLRIDVAGQTPRTHKSAMGQFMTPAPVAAFMAGLFEPRDGPFRLLDPGAGLGALTCAALDRWKTGGLGEGSMTVEVHEMDDRLRSHLVETLAGYVAVGVSMRAKGDDYLAAAADDIEHGKAHFTHAIINPPYKKIGIGSDARTQARRAGLETVNLYSAFVGLALSQLRTDGQLVAIIPRSFCNGPYYKPFRKFLLERAALKHIHLFDSRTQAFRDDDVLQENVILLLERGGKQGPVKVTLSTDDSFSDIRERTLPFATIVKPGDAECFIHIPTEDEDVLGTAPSITHSLKDLGIGVSTGPVVDFRMREHLVSMPTKTSVPLLYSVHFTGTQTTWPIKGSKKPNAIERNKDTERWLFPGGTYIAVRRFSSKEEKRRIVASLVHPDTLGKPERIGFENHLNIFHEGKQPLPEQLAWGLFAYLNSTVVDDHFRRFNGHTQVNATDLRNIRYPSRVALIKLGAWALKSKLLTQSVIDKKMESLLK